MLDVSVAGFDGDDDGDDCLERYPLPSLLEFIRSAKECEDGRVNTCSWLKEEGFKSLYVRYGLRYVNGRTVTCLDIANVTVTYPRTGTLTRLIQKVRTEFPGLCIYLENVLNVALWDVLVRKGFAPSTTSSGCFYLE